MELDIGNSCNTGNIKSACRVRGTGVPPVLNNRSFVTLVRMSDVGPGRARSPNVPRGGCVAAASEMPPYHPSGHGPKGKRVPWLGAISERAVRWNRHCPQTPNVQKCQFPLHKREGACPHAPHSSLVIRHSSFIILHYSFMRLRPP